METQRLIKNTHPTYEKVLTTEKHTASDVKVNPSKIQNEGRTTQNYPKPHEKPRMDSTLNEVYQQVLKEQKAKDATSKIMKLVTMVKSIITSLFFKIYVKSSQSMTEVETNSIKCIVTDPPYYHNRKHKNDMDEIGQDRTVDAYISRLAAHLHDCHRVLKPDGSMFIIIRDSIIDKCQQLIPERLSYELQKQGFILRQRIVWRKTTAMYSGNNSSFTPECESILWFVKNKNFTYNEVTVPLNAKKRKPDIFSHENTYGTYRIGCPVNPKSKNLRDCWDDEVIKSASCNAQSSHLPKRAYSPERIPFGIANICIAKVCQPGDTVLDPFCGTAVTGKAALMNECNFIGYELNQNLANVAKYRLQKCQQDIASLSSKAKTNVRSIVPAKHSKKEA
jgi:DNA modification methylase